MTDSGRNYIPALPTVSQSCLLTSYLQQQYPDYFQDVFGTAGSHTDVFGTAGSRTDVFDTAGSRTDVFGTAGSHTDAFDTAGSRTDVSEHAGTMIDLTGRFECSAFCPTTVDQCQDTRMTVSGSQGHDPEENVNASSCSQQSKPKSKPSTTQKQAKVYVCKKNQVPAPNIACSTRHPLLTCVTKSALTDLNRKLDLWLGKLKTDVKADFSKIIIQALECQRQSHQMEIIEMLAERQHLDWKLSELKDRADTCSECLQEKDAVIDSMLQVLAGQKNRQVLAQTFCHTKTGHMQKYAESLATLHYECHLKQKVLRAWLALVKCQWEKTFEKLCRNKAELTSRKQTGEYQNTINCLNEEINKLKLQLEHMKQERQLYVMNVKKAFLRGVCALNTETLSAFTLEEDYSSHANTETMNASTGDGDGHFLQSLLADMPCVPRVLGACQPVRGTHHPVVEQGLSTRL